MGEPAASASVSPPDPGPSWITATIHARRRALDAASLESRAIAAVRLARALAWSADDAAASRVLLDQRRALRGRAQIEEVARIELGMCELALLLDDEDRASVHLEEGRDAPADDLPVRQALASWLGARRGAHRTPFDLLDEDRSPWQTEVADALLLELAWTPGPLQDEIGRRIRGSDVRTRALLAVVTSVAIADPVGLPRALRSLEKAGLARDLGRSILRALAVAPALLASSSETSELARARSLTPWIALAQSSLGESASWRDRVAVRHAWRAHGRRDADRAVPRDVAAKLDARDRVRAHVQSALSVGLDRQLRALEVLELAISPTHAPVEVHDALDGLHDAIELLDTGSSVALDELGRSEGDLTVLVAATFAERERARAMARVLTDLEAASDVDALLEMLVRVIAEQVGASAVVIAERVAHVGLRSIAAIGIDPADERWIDAAEHALDRPIGPERGMDHDRRFGSSDAPPLGPMLVVPMRASGTDGAIYVDKSSSAGGFSAADQMALEVLASYGGLALARSRATNASASLGRRLAATMDAMRDGVIAIDREGIVTAVNEPATRALRIDAARLLGRRLDAIPELLPLAAVLSTPERPDSAVVRLPTTSVVVTAREIQGEGIVATLLEYERAQKMAQKLVGPRTRYTFADLRGNDPTLLQALEMARRAAAVDASVLIVGESGTGKELLAQAIHAGGPRGREPFVAINCAAFPRDLLEAELFGYERGAFTGARAEGSVGKFELAGDGTILLDEIVDLPLDMQAKLLRVLQERVVVRLGSNAERPVRARVLATAQRDLAVDVERGKFRLDLLHRLRVLQIQLPPLRHRPADIPVIAQHYLRRFAERQGKAVREIAGDVEQALLVYAWPGNVRELANAIEGEVSLMPAEALVLDRVPMSLVGQPPSSRRDLTSTPPASIIPLAAVERRAYIDAYEKSDRSVTRAARALGVSKVTFYGKLRQFGMHPSETTGEVSAYRGGRRSAEQPPASGEVTLAYSEPASVKSEPPQ